MVVMTSNDVMIVMTSTAKKEWKSLLSLSYQVKIILDIEQALNSHLMMAIRQNPTEFSMRQPVKTQQAFYGVNQTEANTTVLKAHRKLT